MHSIGPCEICGQGLRGIRVCPRGDLIAVCDECEAVWISPAESRPSYPEQPDLPCPRCGAGLWTAPAHWADWREISDSIWAAAVVAQYN